MSHVCVWGGCCGRAGREGVQIPTFDRDGRGMPEGLSDSNI